jgi:acyl-CoA thioesterase-2
MPTIDDVRQVVSVEAIDAGSALGRTEPSGTNTGGLFGGLMIAQALSACAHTVPEGAIPDSIQACLLGPGRPGKPIDWRIRVIRDGGVLQHRDVMGHQDDKLIVQATVVSTVPAVGLDWQHRPAPDVAPPDTSPEAISPWGAGLGRDLFEVAHPMSDDNQPPPHNPIWIRSTVDVVDDPWIEGAVRAYWSDFGMNWEARATHHELDPEQVMSLSATHSMWFHRRYPLTEWHLFDPHTSSVAGNQALVESVLQHSSGALVATISQRVFIRRPQSPSG